MSKFSSQIYSLAIFVGLSACGTPNDSSGPDQVHAAYSPATDSAFPASEGSVSTSGAASPTPVAKGSVAGEAGSGTDGVGGSQHVASLTAGSFSDALNLTAFMNYLQADASTRVSLPDASPFTFEMELASLKAIVPVKPTTAATKLDIALVIDVTGSMGDELSYLQKEWNTVTTSLQTLFPALALRMSLVVYKDTTDEFVTAGIPFTESREAFQAELAKYSAGGGGDQPEAVDAALATGNNLQWNADSRKVLFWVADAAPHENKEAASVAEVLKLKEKGVSIYPLAASGIGPKAELVMRLGALLTGGQYLFLTDDSGIGNSHAEPHIPCYTVEQLKHLLLRVLTDEVSGTRSEPKPEHVVRTVGKPVQGVCQPAP